MPDPLDGLFELLMARIRALEEQVSTMRDEFESMASGMGADIAELRAEVCDADCDGWGGFTD